MTNDGDAGAGPAAPDTGGPAVGKDPIKVVLEDMLAKLELFAEEADAALTCDDLLHALGSKSHTFALLIFSLLNLLPGPPGYNFLMAVIATVIAIKMLVDSPIQVWGFIGRMRLPKAVVIKMLGLLVKLADRATRVSRQRMTALTAQGARPLLALIALILAVVQIAPVPFMNLLPAVGVAMICVGQLNRDGLLVVIGTLVGAFGSFLLVVVVWLLFGLVTVVDDAIEDLVYPEAGIADMRNDIARVEPRGRWA